MRVIFAPRARQALDEIWDWNASEYSDHHAESYVSWLRKEAIALSKNRAAARPVPNFPGASYVTLRKGRAKGHAHVAVFQVIGDELHILGFHHTAQDWQSRYGPKDD